MAALSTIVRPLPRLWQTQIQTQGELIKGIVEVVKAAYDDALKPVAL
jgi:hypothetical protein